MFTIEEEFKVKFSIFYTNFYIYQQAKDFIGEQLVLNKNKLVALYTKLIFTAGNTGSQRSEALNSLIKDFGSLK